MAPPIERVLQLGFRFEPKPEDAVTYYLPRLIAGAPMHAAVRSFVHSTDIYAWEPAVLAARYRPTPKAGDRFFFTTFKRQPGNSGRGVRSAGPGYWHTQGHTTDVLNDAGVKVGEAKKFRYMKAKKFTGWLMDEFSSCAADTVVGDRQYVLCKMYVSPRTRPDSAARQESAAFVAFAPPPPPAPEEDHVAAPNKRSAPPIAQPPRPTKRIRAAAKIPTPPPVEQPPLPSPVQAPAPPAPCSPVRARDPFCMEESSTAAAQEHDGADFDWAAFYEQAEEAPDQAQDGDDCDFDFAKSLEGSLVVLETEKQAEDEASTEEADDETDEEAPAQAQDGDDCDFEFAMSLEGSLVVLETEKQAEDEASTKEADDETDWFPSFKPAQEQAYKKSDPPFDPTSGRKRKPL